MDEGGFPRADIDVHLVRQQRNRYSRLRTDHKTLSAHLENLLRIALAPTEQSSNTNGTHMQSNNSHATPVLDITPTPPHSTNSEVPAPDEAQEGDRLASDVDYRQPFALVDQVFPASPASEAGLQMNDKLVAIGAVSLRSSPTPSQALSLLPGLVRQHENIAVDVVVKRQNSSDQTETLNLSLTPRRWGGQGLLGFHIVPLQVSQVDPHYNPEVATATMNRNVPGI